LNETVPFYFIMVAAHFFVYLKRCKRLLALFAFVTCFNIFVTIK